MRPNLRTGLLLLSMLALAATACGEPRTTPGSGGGSSDTADKIRVVVRADRNAEPKTGFLSCGSDEEASGFIEDAEGACRALRDSTALLLNGPPDNVACTEIYGGPQEARITGTIEEQRVDMTVSREDGCAIALWDELEDLIGPPPEVQL